ncbi:flavodoxin [Enterococcus saigonensis]|uniref:Flavodoxin n=2 Tax=Enterococcus saigonensis TaxID=1805431 RepID=A0A679IRH9_9ENTE|nr:flavodoxin [Enterococcus saigonensis]
MKKKIWIISTCLTAMFLMSACSSDEQEGSASAPDENISTTTESGNSNINSIQTSGNVLVAYFSVPETAGVDAVSRASRVVEDGEVIGNTQFVAQTIQQETNGDIFRIETVQEYPGDHDELVDFGENELAEEARPELSSQIENLDKYDTIFLGYPIWAGDLPMPLYTLLESTDFTDKTIIPFSTHGGSGFSNTIDILEQLQPNATIIKDGITISRDSVPDSRDEIVNWVSNLSL